MPLKTFVKASSISNLSDARYFAALEVDWVSYVCNPHSEKFVAPQQLVEMKNWLSGPKHCGECLNMDFESIIAVIDECGLEGVEVDVFNRNRKELANKVTVFTRILVDKTMTFDDLTELIREKSTGSHHFILDFKTNAIGFDDLEEGIPFQLEELKVLAEACPVLLDVPLKANQVKSVLETQLGLNLHGGEEERVGVRSFDDVQDIMEQLEVWE
ncbi:MAG: hypothetical protein KTR13_01835 [Saprospiraceae bacterium]|nr:hypothetical protein [Saprospiraceae bacterium]